MKIQNRGKPRAVVGTISAVLALFAAIVVSVLPAPPAAAWNALYCRYVGTSALVSVQTNSPSTPFAAAGDEWEVGTTGITVNNTATAGDRNVLAYSSYYGATGWSGITDHYDALGGDGPPCMSTGHWNYTKIAVVVNNSYLSNDAQRKMIAIHELGHFLGLGHNNATTSCPVGWKAVAVMYYSDARASGDCPVSSPQTDDRNGINALY